MRERYGKVAAFCAANRIIALVVLFVAMSLLFANIPAIDLAVSRIFYVNGQGFPLSRNETLQQLRIIGSDVPVGLGAVVITALILKVVFPRRPCVLPARFTLYFASLYLLGPILLVNGVFKSLWGRPRPLKIEAFGGHFPFVEAWSFGDQVFTHRSFISGEAAAITCLLPLALFVPRPWRGPLATMIGLAIIAVSVNRLAFGAHFLSDIALSIMLTITLAVALRQIMFVSHAETFSDERIEARLSAIGFGIEKWLHTLVGSIRVRMAGVITAIRAWSVQLALALGVAG